MSASPTPGTQRGEDNYLVIFVVFLLFVLQHVLHYLQTETQVVLVLLEGKNLFCHFEPFGNENFINI